jgi:hypothetical protein
VPRGGVLIDTERAYNDGRETGVRVDELEAMTGDVGEREVTRDEMDMGD